MIKYCMSLNYIAKWCWFSKPVYNSVNVDDDEDFIGPTSIWDDKIDMQHLL